MTENEQIQEIAWDICDIPKHPTVTNCEECGGKHCHATYYAGLAYRKDYRKVKRGEWIKPWTMKPYGKAYGTPYCSVCKQLDNEKGDFCRFCGADMRKEGEGENEGDRI